jgi:glycosyltransferase involved in cell wall biosynthesis
MNGVKPRVTVITACRNAARTIEATILSVVNQGYEGIEYIVVDAMSDDGTADIISKYADKISLWIREPDKGIADAWNKGIKHASGEIISILNADDFYTPGTVSLAVSAFMEHQDCGFVYGDLKVVNLAKGFERIEKGLPEYRAIIHYNMVNLPHPTVFVKKAVYDRIGVFSSGYRIAMDYEFVRRMAYHGVEGKHIPQILAVMRDGGVSETDRITASREVMTISIAYGFNRFLAFGYFLFKCSRTYAGKAIGYLGVDMATLRQLRNSARAFMKLRRNRSRQESREV